LVVTEMVAQRARLALEELISRRASNGHRSTVDGVKPRSSRKHHDVANGLLLGPT
jgi:hypothetical protein